MWIGTKTPRMGRFAAKDRQHGVLGFEIDVGCMPFDMKENVFEKALLRFHRTGL